MLQSRIDAFLQAEQLPPSYAGIMQDCHRKIARWVAQQQETKGRTLLLGINGAQGTGKTTMARGLELYLQTCHQRRTVSLSLDDFYLGRAARERLAAEVHPLLKTRGVPGTHDIPLALATLDALTTASEQQAVRLPRFDKSSDDRKAEQDCPLITDAPEIIILEGWCLGLEPQEDEALERPINYLEAMEDRDGRWRRHANRQLAGEYQSLFQRLDCLIMLRVPSFHCVLEWRSQQEKKLAAGLDPTTEAPGIMDREQIHRFVQHFERLTRHGLKTLPPRADLVLQLDHRQQIDACRPALDTLCAAAETRRRNDAG